MASTIVLTKEIYLDKSLAKETHENFKNSFYLVEHCIDYANYFFGDLINQGVVFPEGIAENRAVVLTDLYMRFYMDGCKDCTKSLIDNFCEDISLIWLGRNDCVDAID